MQRVVNKLLSILKAAYVRRAVLKERVFEERLEIEGFPTDAFEHLSEDEKRQIVDLWGEDAALSFKEYELLKHFRGFDPRYLTHSLYLPIVAHKLNNYHYTKMFEHKSLFDTLVKCNAVRYPKCLVRVIDHEFYDSEKRQLSWSQAVKVLASVDRFIVKKSSDSSGGKSFVICERDEVSKENVEALLEARKGYDFVCQEFVRQSPTMAKFNQSSVNTLRVTTLYLNGRFSVLSIVLRMGRKGSVVDNFGAGGIMVPVAKDGMLNDWGWTNRHDRVFDNDGVYFKGTRIEEIPDLLRRVEAVHMTDYSLCKLIGWDVTFGEDGIPVVIEVNTSQPGIFTEQLLCGPLFGERTKEVADYCKSKKFVYCKSLCSY